MKPIHSMTGFGRAAEDLEHANITVEVRTVNHRYLEVHLNLPPGWVMFEAALRAKVQKALKRGRVDVWLNCDREREGTHKVTVDRKLMQSLAESLETVRKDLGLAGELSIDLLAGFSNTVQIERVTAEPDDALFEVSSKILDNALTQLIEMRRTEGKALETDLNQRLDRLEQLSATAAVAAEELPAAALVRLKERVASLLDDHSVEEERLNQELALMADRMDVTEEVVRLRTHIQAMRDILETGGEVGKKLDFLLQELGREANTLTSKARSTDVTTPAMEIKAEIEKIREQARNIE